MYHITLSGPSLSQHNSDRTPDQNQKENFIKDKTKSENKNIERVKSRNENMKETFTLRSRSKVNTNPMPVRRSPRILVSKIRGVSNVNRAYSKRSPSKSMALRDHFRC